MSNALQLIPGQKYRVKKDFIDFDKIHHPIGETWVFVRTNFVPYHDGLTLHVTSESSTEEIVYRLQWTIEEQASIIDNFHEFIETI